MSDTLKAEVAEQRLVGMLQQKWGTVNALDMHRFWPVFKEFTKVKFGVSPADDLLLFECSMQQEAQEKSFYAGFIRQFSLYSDSGAYSHMEQMGCNFCYPASDFLAGYEETVWSDESQADDSVEAYLSMLESLPVFQAIAVMVPQKVEFWSSKI